MEDEEIEKRYVIETVEHIYTCPEHGRVITIVQTKGVKPSKNVKCSVMFCDYFLELME